MEESSNLIRHKGFIKKVNPDSLIISIINESACSSCHANGACSVSDFKEKDIEVRSYNQTYNPGQSVTVLFKESNGFKALFFGYILPLITLVMVLALSLNFTNNEGLSGLLALTILIPYYTTLYFFRHHLKKMLKFHIEEIN